MVFSSSAEWIMRIRGYLSSLTTPLQIDSATQLEAELEQRPASVVLFDLQTSGAADRLPYISKTWPQAVIIAFGLTSTDPMAEAEQLGVYETEDHMIDRRRLVSLVRRALDHLALAQENQLLRSETTRLNTLSEAAARKPDDAGGRSLDVRDFSSALRHFSNVDTLLQRLADEVGSSLRVSRVGIFCRTRDSGTYRLRAGLRCLETTLGIEYDESHSLVRWLKIHAHVISRTNVEHVREPAMRLWLTQTLDQFGAEVLVPLQSRERLVGWLFVGHLATGFPFENSHIENLIATTDYVSTTLENALLYEEVTIQKTLAETLLHSLPAAIIAVDAEGVVRWYNDSARTLLEVAPEEALAHPVEVLGSRLADVLRATLGERGGEQTRDWTDTVSRHSFSLHTQRLINQKQCLGAVAIMHDTTDQKSLKEKQDRLDRATFWAELAASMSHEVRNPLVSIKVFAQLLPERYADKEFQNEFREIVSAEVDRLNGIVEQINDFAHPPKLELQSLDIRRCVEKSIGLAVPSEGVKVSVSAPDRLPAVRGDERALGEAFTHILRNAVEALAGRTGGSIDVTIRTRSRADSEPMIDILFKDNGPGIAPDLLDKLFSPFCTTKARGLGLGLPIAKRTVMDHNGQIVVNANTLGVCVSVTLPALRDNLQAV
jgi:two-component system nitrogen regulation sensor histidine kinase GlnL